MKKGWQGWRGCKEMDSKHFWWELWSYRLCGAKTGNDSQTNGSFLSTLALTLKNQEFPNVHRLRARMRANIELVLCPIPRSECFTYTGSLNVHKNPVRRHNVNPILRMRERRHWHLPEITQPTTGHTRAHTQAVWFTVIPLTTTHTIHPELHLLGLYPKKIVKEFSIGTLISASFVINRKKENSLNVQLC